MEDESEIIKLLSKDEKLGFGEVKSEERYVGPPEYKPLEPDPGGLKKRLLLTLVIIIIIAVAVFLIFFMSVFQEHHGLVGYWDFNEGSGNILYDKSGNNNYGKILGATWTSGKSGYALEFNGVSDYVDLGETSFLSGATEATVSLWIKLADYPIYREEYRMFELGTYYGSSPNTILLYIRPNTNDIIFLVNNNISVKGGVIPLNEWVHIVGTFKGGDYTKIYVDGTLKDTEMTFVPNSLNNENMSTKIGGSVFGSNYYFKGAIDDVRIYNYALSTDEIASLP